MDVQFTAGMELKLDKIEEEHLDWIKLLKDFYGPFHEGRGRGARARSSTPAGRRRLTNATSAASQMLYRISKNGFFLACSDRECGNTQPVDRAGQADASRGDRTSSARSAAAT